MRKLQISLIVILIVGLFIGAYIYFKPKKAPIVYLGSGTEFSFNYTDIERYLLKQEGKYTLWFCDGEVNCAFVNDHIMGNLIKKYPKNDFKDLIFVDMSHVRKDLSPAILHQKWGFSVYPAFVIVEVTEGQIAVIDWIEWSNNATFTSEDLKQWFIEHELWKGPQN